MLVNASVIKSFCSVAIVIVVLLASTPARAQVTNPRPVDVLETVACDSFFWQRKYVTYYESVTDTCYDGSDTLRVLRLTINRSIRQDLFDTVCVGSSVFFGNAYRGQTGDYPDSLATQGGCDSVVTLHLWVMPRPHIELSCRYDCTSKLYRLNASTSGIYLKWTSEPHDAALAGHESEYTLLLNPSVTTTYYVAADYKQEGFCPNRDSVEVEPYEPPQADLEVTPAFLTPGQMGLKAVNRCSQEDYVLWYVDGQSYYNYQVVHYEASPLSDSLTVAVEAVSRFCRVTAKRVLPVLKDDIYLPNAFMPQAEEPGLFKVAGKGVLEAEVWVYNRAGLLVFHTDDLSQGWDGTSNGSPCPRGSYVYAVRYRTSLMPANWQNRRGTVTLIR